MAYGRRLVDRRVGFIQGTPGVAKSTQGKQDSADGQLPHCSLHIRRDAVRAPAPTRVLTGGDGRRRRCTTPGR